MNSSGFAATMAGATDLSAPGTRYATSPEQQEKDRAVLAARVILRAPNIDKNSDVAIIARQFLKALGLAA